MLLPCWMVAADWVTGNPGMDVKEMRSCKPVSCLYVLIIICVMLY